MSKLCHCKDFPFENKFPTPRVEGISEILRALAPLNRLKLFLLIDHFPHCVRDLVADTGLSQTLVSHHLATLSEAGLVKKKRLQSIVNYATTERGRLFAEKLREYGRDLEMLGSDAE